MCVILLEMKWDLFCVCVCVCRCFFFNSLALSLFHFNENNALLPSLKIVRYVFDDSVAILNKGIYRDLRRSIWMNERAIGVLLV